jgi:NAD(P)H dehydrogenase (quinone)
MSAPVAVLGAGGPTGRRVCAALFGRTAIRAVLHRYDADFPDVSEVVSADLGDPTTVRRALTGAAAVYVITPAFHPNEDLLMTNAVTAAEQAGVERIVLHSVLHPHTASMPHHLRKAAGEQALQRCQVPWTVLQPAMYAQTVSTILAGNAEEGFVPVPWNLDAPFTPVHLGDVAEAAATVLTEPGHSHATYELAGPQVLSTRDMIADLAQITGRELHPRHTLPADVKLPTPGAAAGLAAMCAEYDAHGFVGNANVLCWLLGREPLSFADACAADLAH